MRKTVTIATCAAFLSACLTTKYETHNDEPEVRFSGKRPGETFIRHVDVAVTRHHFVLGAIPNHSGVDIAKVADLQPGQALVNTRVEAEMTFPTMLAWIGLGVVSFGIGWAVWTPRTTTIKGDLVDVKGVKDHGPVAQEKGKEEVAGKEEEEPEKAPPEPGPFKGAVVPLAGEYTQADATSACGTHGAKLPTRAELKSAREGGFLNRNAGDLWTADGKGDDGWIFSAGSGVTFLKDHDSSYAAVCIKTGT
jgi:hypothetical protein